MASDGHPLLTCFPPGWYVIHAERTYYTSDLIPSEDDILGVLPPGGVFYVDEVAVLPDSQRIRGRLEEPPGWISILELEHGYTWAVRQEEDESNASTHSGTGSGTHSGAGSASEPRGPPGGGGVSTRPTSGISSVMSTTCGSCQCNLRSRLCSEGFECDVCGDEVPSGCSVLECRPCGYGVCFACLELIEEPSAALRRCAEPSQPEEEVTPSRRCPECSRAELVLLRCDADVTCEACWDTIQVGESVLECQDCGFSICMGCISRDSTLAGPDLGEIPEDPLASHAGYASNMAAREEPAAGAVPFAAPAPQPPSVIPPHETQEEVLIGICETLSSIRKIANNNGVPGESDEMQRTMRFLLDTMPVPEEEQIVCMARVYNAVAVLRLVLRGALGGSEALKNLRRCLPLAKMPGSEQVVKEADVHLALFDLKARRSDRDGQNLFAGVAEQRNLREALGRADCGFVHEGGILQVEGEVAMKGAGPVGRKPCLLPRELVRQAAVELHSWNMDNAYLREDAKLDTAMRRCLKGFKPKEQLAGDMLRTTITDLRMKGTIGGRLQEAEDALGGWEEERRIYMEKEEEVARRWANKKG
eukprot:TRINITY_DN75354_c0_g1_i1.p1 TRINITY_DN75354_c0_g1~~TRINITY_DN75354_c0_g1_i1.p1  ORF type:complete len:637 (+),score=118.08 TRINITY_DN75354_c0_g1_i1:147-1913(+)